MSTAALAAAGLLCEKLRRKTFTPRQGGPRASRGYRRPGRGSRRSWSFSPRVHGRRIIQSRARWKEERYPPNREWSDAIVLSQPEASRLTLDATTALSSSGNERARRLSAASPRSSPRRPRSAPIVRAAGLRPSASPSSIALRIRAASPGISGMAAARLRSPSTVLPAQCSDRADGEGASRLSTAASR